MTAREVVIGHQLGLHARVSAKLVQLSSRFDSDIRIALVDGGDDQVADARSILSILLLAARHGARVRVSAEGDDEAAAVAAVCGYLETEQSD
jgi:phosphocarrier protein